MTPNALIATSLTVAMTSMATMSLMSRPAAIQTLPRQDAGVNAPGPILFSSNGCSGFREARFFSCCFVHDLAFWAGGTRSDRARADRDLRSCLLEISHDWIVAGIGYMLVRLEMVPGAFIDDGWGRAWRNTNRRRWAPLTLEQQRQVADERLRVCKSLTLNPQTGRYRVDDRREIRPNQARQVCGGDPPAIRSSKSPATSR